METETLNPITQARELIGLTQTRLAMKTGISRQHVSKLEQGCHRKVNERVLKYLSDQLGGEPKPNEIQLGYTAWQQRHRRLALSQHRNNPIRPVADFISSGVCQPTNTETLIRWYLVFKAWREEYWNSQNEFCLDMCVKPFDVSKYEDGKLYSMPSYLREALEDVSLLKGFKSYER